MDNIVIKIDKLVHGGQGLGELPDGRKVFVWNALPGEEVGIRIIKKRKDYAEAIAEEIIVASKDRINPVEDNYLSTSPWQILDYASENKHKQSIVEEIFHREHISLPSFTFKAPKADWHYRNKMEYSFWGDDDGLHLALHQRGSRNKQIISGSKLAMPVIDQAANKILSELRKHDIRAGSLKTLMLRCNQNENVAASLFVKSEDFIKLDLPEGVNGIKVYYSNPKSPASVATRLIYEIGSSELTDTLNGKPFKYDVDSFFQVNIPIFNQVLDQIKRFIDERPLVDMYGGVGSIGIGVGRNHVKIIELDEATATMAKINAAAVGAEVVQTSSEKALEYIKAESILVVDPPRAGLHKDVVQKIMEAKPERLIYLSCNPATQARDMKELLDGYEIEFFEGYNFFPHTPHIETLAILQRSV